MLIRNLLILSFAFLVTGNAGAHKNEETKIFPYKYQIKDLSNGLRIIVVPTDYPNIVALQIPVQVGSRNEIEPGKSGFAHFFEHMMFRGTEKYSSERYTEILKNAGADQNAYTNDDLTNYHITFSKEDLETVLALEADRFKNLRYTQADFKTEAKAVLGEYNKNASNPLTKLIETQRNVAFKTHTYKHTTMGFIQDIESMPDQFDYSLAFFDRYYRPEKITIILAGDLQTDKTFQLVEKYWGDWQPGNYQPNIPSEPEPQGPIYEHVNWNTVTLPWITVAFHGPAYSENENDMAVMDIIAEIAFSESAPIYQKLVIKEQKADQLFAYFPDRTDPYLLTVAARVKESADIAYVREEIQKAFAQMRNERPSEQRLHDIKARMKYAFAQRMDSSEAIASMLANSAFRSRDPESINRVYQLYNTIDTKVIRQKARDYFTDKRMVVVSLSHEPLAPDANKPGSVDAFAKANYKKSTKIATVLQANHSPTINIRLLFNIGASADPKGKEGLAQLTAAMITDAGSKNQSYEAIQKALYPMAGSFTNQVDKEMTVFMGETHIDNLNAYYEIITEQLLNPGWDEQDFKRVKTNLINTIAVSLRQNNDEELGKEMLYEALYHDHPYGHLNTGHINSLGKLNLDDLKAFYKNYTRERLLLGLAGNFPEEFLQKIKHDLEGLPAGKSINIKIPKAKELHGRHTLIVQKETRSTAISFGFPININRSHPDFAGVWLARSYLGEHRSTNSHLFKRIREIRGMNYGDYAYIEYFPNGMFQFHPNPNLGRQQQIFQIWIRPVENIENAHFATRVALYELNKLINQGISQQDFEATRNYLLKFINILTKTQDRQLGYALDSDYYGINDFNEHMSKALKKLTLKDVNRTIKKYLQTKDMQFIFVTKDAEDLKNRLIQNTTSIMQYQSEQPHEIIEEDKIIQNYPLNLSKDKVNIIAIDNVFL